MKGDGFRMRGVPLADRFWAKVRRTDGCWEWTGAKFAAGYGRLSSRSYRGKSLRAHRVAYRLLVGVIPEGMELDHLCRNRACVNPAHLEPVVHRVNILRGVAPPAVHAQKTHCPQGHPYDEANTWRRITGARQCRACNALRSTEWRRARKGAAA